MERKSPKYRHLTELLIALSAIVVLNLIAEFKFFRVDLTEDKIHSLNDKTKEFLTNEVEDVINIFIYLDGNDLPVEIQKFRQAIKDKLDAFQSYAGNKIKYKFIDINADPELTDDYKTIFAKNNVNGNVIRSKFEGQYKSTVFYPLAEIRYRSNFRFIDFMGDYGKTNGSSIGNTLSISESYLENKTNLIEYEFLSAFYNVLGKPKPTVSFLMGHGELSKMEVSSSYLQLKYFFNVDTVAIIQKFGGDTNTVYKENVHALDKTDVLIIAKPEYPFSDKEMILLDQFLMKGGKVIWSLDMIDDNEDSLSFPEKFYTMSKPNKQLDQIEKMLYKYGAGIKSNFISNKFCASQYRYDVTWNPYYLNQQNQASPIPPMIDNWYPYATVTMENSIYTKNVGRIKLQYPSSININQGSPVKKTVVLETDQLYKEFPAITRIRYDETIFQKDLNEIEPAGTFFEPLPDDPALAQGIRLPLAVMLEGEFNAAISKADLTPEFIAGLEASNIKYLEKSKPTSMMVIGDGDFLRSEVFNGQPINLGFDLKDLFSKSGNPEDVTLKFGNTTFLHNCIDHMVGNDYLIPLRSRVIPQRKLNEDEVYYNRGKWQLINLIVPSIFVLVLGLIQWFIRRKRYLA